VYDMAHAYVRHDSSCVTCLTQMNVQENTEFLNWDSSHHTYCHAYMLSVYLAVTLRGYVRSDSKGVCTK